MTHAHAAHTSLFVRWAFVSVPLHIDFPCTNAIIYGPFGADVQLCYVDVYDTRTVPQQRALVSIFLVLGVELCKQ